MANSKTLPVRISFFGTGCTIYVGTFNEKNWYNLNDTANKLKMDLTSAVFYPPFYKLLNNTHIHSLFDLGNVYRLKGLINSNHSVVQIQVYRKRRRSIEFREIIHPVTLFPIYNTDVHSMPIEMDKRTLIVVEKEIGQFLKFNVNPVSFSLEELDFEVSYPLVTGSEWGFGMLTNLYYKGTLLIPVEGNSLVSEQYVLTEEILK